MIKHSSINIARPDHSQFFRNYTGSGGCPVRKLKISHMDIIVHYMPRMFFIDSKNADGGAVALDLHKCFVVYPLTYIGGYHALLCYI